LLAWFDERRHADAEHVGICLRFGRHCDILAL
jgi:hypothetical protein